MNRYRITYRDASPGAPTFSLVVRAYDKAHAEERFFDDGDTGWEILNIERLP